MIYHLFHNLTKSRTQTIQLTRSRAYHEDNNAHVEQNNWIHVRQWISYDRLDRPGFPPLMDDLSNSGWRLVFNLFCPSAKLIEKKRVASRTKTVKRYDKPKTP